MLDGWRRGELLSGRALAIVLASLIPSSGLRTLHAAKRGVGFALRRGANRAQRAVRRRAEQGEFARASRWIRRRSSRLSRCVVITDGEQRSALALARSLGRAGHRVIVCASNRRSLAGVSRYAAECVATPSPLEAPDAFADAVTNATRRYSADVLLPVVEASLLAILPRRKEIDPCVIPFPSSERFAEICDKSLVLAAAGRHGIATPRQHVLRQRGDLDRLNGALRFPVVAKPARSVSGDAAGRFKAGSEYADDQAALAALIDRVRGDGYPMLVQERIVGPGIGIFVLMWDGELRAAFSHRRIREKPPSGGVSVVSESIALDAALLDRSVQLLRDFDWRGVAMVEYKLDARTGTPYLMEVNGRFWGSLQLAIDAGVDFPNILVNAACGLSDACDRRLQDRSPPALGVGRRRQPAAATAPLAVARLPLPDSASGAIERPDRFRTSVRSGDTRRGAAPRRSHAFRSRNSKLASRTMTSARESRAEASPRQRLSGAGWQRSFDGGSGAGRWCLAYHNIVPTGERPTGESSLHLPQRQFATHLDLIASAARVVPLDSLFEESDRVG